MAGSAGRRPSKPEWSDDVTVWRNPGPLRRARSDRVGAPSPRGKRRFTGSDRSAMRFRQRRFHAASIRSLVEEKSERVPDDRRSPEFGRGASMTFEMKTICGSCAVDLLPDGDAFICSFECTYCSECAGRHEHRCPNCDGELVLRPRRKERDAPFCRSDSLSRALRNAADPSGGNCRRNVRK